MAYRFAQERTDASAFASGQVLHSLPGQTAFPVRLASEIFQRCVARLERAGAAPPYRLYDPCCGGAQMLATLGLLHADAIGSVVGSDADPEAVRLAARNLALLTPAGMEARIAELRALHERFGKESHAAAVQHAVALRERLLTLTQGRTIGTRIFCADGSDPEALRRELSEGGVDLAIADVPYGQRSAWRGMAAEPEQASGPSPLWRLLEALHLVVAPHGVVAIAANKEQVAQHERYRRLARLRLGKRQVVLLALA